MALQEIAIALVLSAVKVEAVVAGGAARVTVEPRLVQEVSTWSPFLALT